MGVRGGGEGRVGGEAVCGHNKMWLLSVCAYNLTSQCTLGRTRLTHTYPCWLATCKAVSLWDHKHLPTHAWYTHNTPYNPILMDTHITHLIIPY